MKRVKPIMLSRQEEYDLIVAWRDRRDEKARERLILAFMPLVYKTVKRFPKRGDSEEDLLQEGVLGLIDAIDRFDPDNGNRFSAFGRWWVLSYVGDAAYRGMSVVRPPMTADIKRRHRKGERIFSEFSLEGEIAGKFVDGSQATYADILPSNELPPDHASDFINLEKQIKTAFRKMKPRERRIVKKRHFSLESATLDDLGKEFGVSRERIRQVEEAALKRFAKAIGGSWKGAE